MTCSTLPSKPIPLGSPPSCSKASIPAAAKCGTMPPSFSGTREPPTISPTSGRPNQGCGTIGGPTACLLSGASAQYSEGDGNMLDQTVVVWGSAHPHASHNTRNYPIQVAGGNALGFKHGNLHSFEGEKGAVGKPLRFDASCGERAGQVFRRQHRNDDRVNGLGEGLMRSRLIFLFSSCLGWFGLAFGKPGVPIVDTRSSLGS